MGNPLDIAKLLSMKLGLVTRHFYHSNNTSSLLTCEIISPKIFSLTSNFGKTKKGEIERPTDAKINYLIVFFQSVKMINWEKTQHLLCDKLQA